MMYRLIDTPSIKTDESTLGYLRRLAICNGYGSWRELVQAVGFKPTKAVLAHDFPKLERALGLEHRSRNEAFGDKRTVDDFFLRPKTEAICPHCILQDEYLRAPWSHCFGIACPTHKCLLVDHCSTCQSPLENTRAKIAYCDCGFDLRCHSTIEASPVQCWVSARVSRDLVPVEPIAEIGSADDYMHLASLLFQLSVRFNPATKVKPGKASRPKTVAQSIAFLDPVLTIFEDVRPRLLAHITSRFKAGNLESFNLSGRLGGWYLALDDLCHKRAAFPVIWEIFSDAVFDNFDGLIRGQTGLTPSLGKQRQYLGFAESAKLIGVSKSVLQVAIDQKLIRVRAGREGVNYAVCMIPREDCEAALKSRREWVSRTRAMNLLGVSDALLQHLINADLLATDDTWHRSLFKAGPINASDLNSLCERLHSLVRERDELHTMTFNQINARRTVDMKAIVSLFQAIFSGKVCPVARNAGVGLGGYVFSSVEVRNYLGTAALQSALTLPQLATATGWKYESIAGWAKQALLETEVAVIQGRQARVVTAPALARFRQVWIPVADLAAAGASKGSAITKHLVAHGIEIKGHSPQKNGAVRGGLIRLSDLVRIAGLAKYSTDGERLMQIGKET